KQGRTGERMGQAIAQTEPGAVIVGDWEQVTPLWYYQVVEGWRPDVQIVYPMERLAEAAGGDRPLYVTRNSPNLWEHWHPSSTGPLIFLGPEPAFDLPPDLVSLDIRWGDILELSGFVYGTADYGPGTVVPLTLYWRALQAPVDDYAVSLRLFDQAGQEIFKIDSQAPVLGTYPTSRWTAGEVVGDYYEIQLPAELSPGVYQWGIILYRILPEGGWENLRVAGTDAELAMGGDFPVK
ncbi:MAG TPA: hypothetical protein VLC52_03490, partial [Anaerolineae bacterium]|nr:hypothetical protein [Anaerolineae bacterium]